MTIGDIVEWIWFVSGKVQSGAINGTEINAAFEVVNIELFNVKNGLPEQYRPGQPYPAQAYNVSKKISDDLRYFVTTTPTPITRNQTGFFPYPTDYADFSSTWYIYKLNNPNGGNPTSSQRPIRILTDSEYQKRLANGIIPPTLLYPIGSMRDMGFIIQPQQINQIYLTYLRYPVTPVFGYTIENQEYIYNPATSVQIEYPATLHPEFAIRVARYLGINLRDDELVKYMETRIAGGQ